MNHKEIVEGLKSEGVYNFIAENYFKMTKKQLKRILLELDFATKDNISEYEYNAIKNDLICELIETWGEFQESLDIENEILDEARNTFRNALLKESKINLIYEHGQFWIRFFDEQEEVDRTFSVIELGDYENNNKFYFEEV